MATNDALATFVHIAQEAKGRVLPLHPSFTSTLSSSRGFHIISSTSLNITESPSPEHQLYILYLLPPSVFIDRYELVQRKQDGFIPSFHVWGETNLELPVEAVDSRGSAVLLYLGEERQIDLPVHLRYLKSRPREDNSTAGFVSLQIPWPTVFWATRPKDPSSLRSGLVKSLHNASLHFVRPSSEHPVHRIEVPTGRMSHLRLVEFFTLIAVLSCFLYVSVGVWKARFRLSRRSSNHHSKAE